MFETIWIGVYTTVLTGLVFFGCHRLWMIGAYWVWRNQPPEPLSRFQTLPQITIQLPLFNERYVAARLLAAMEQIDYPKNKLELQILDDSTDETTEILASGAKRLRAQGWRVSHLRRESRQGFKAGALQYGLEQTDSGIIAIFDADFIPGPDILRACVDYFTDPSVGMVQTRWDHLNRHANVLTRIQALLLDGHLLIEQTVRSRSGKFFNFNGTAGLWRREAIVSGGGWQDDTLTEDLDLSYRAQMAGWRFIFLPEVLTPAELPSEMNAFKIQQHRWAKGAIQTCKKVLPRVLAGPYSPGIKIEALLHLTSNFAYVLLFILALLIFPDPEGRPTRGELFAMHIPVFLFATGSVLLFYLLVMREVGIRWWWWPLYLPALVALGTGLSLNNARAVIEALFNHVSAFARTPKWGLQPRSPNAPPRFYASTANWFVFIEFLLFLHFAHFSILAIQRELWLSVPFFLLFCLGFGYTSLWSLMNFGDWRRRIPGIRSSAKLSHGV